MLDMDTVLIGAGTGIVSAILTFMVSRKDANTRANETVTSALTKTIESLEKHIAHLGGRMAELEKQLEIMYDENVKLLKEVHELRKTLITSGTTE